MLADKIKEFDEIKIELIKMGMNERLASGIAFIYFNNELKIKGLEFVKNELNNEIVRLNSKIDNLEKKLNNKIDSLKIGTKKDIDILSNKIDILELKVRY